MLKSVLDEWKALDYQKLVRLMKFGGKKFR